MRSGKAGEGGAAPVRQGKQAVSEFGRMAASQRGREPPPPTMWSSKNAGRETRANGPWSYAFSPVK